MSGRKRNFTRRRANEDRVLVRPLPGSDHAILVAVADGVSNCADGGAVAHWLIHDRLGLDDLPAAPGTDLCRLMALYLRKVHGDFLARFESDPDMMESACTLAGALARGTEACVFWCGDSPVHLLHRTPSGYEGETLTIPDKIEGTAMLTDCFCGLTPFDFGSRLVALSPGDLLICATDGLLPSARDLAESVTLHGFGASWIERICAESHAFPDSDDVGVAAFRFD